MIVRDAKRRFGCDHFAPEFTLYEYPGPVANWGVQVAYTAAVWPVECAEAFKEAVVRARGAFDIEWPR
ncbi:MAG TPA: hypothetical protein VEU74_04435 [Gemmatimonadales bacterium]|nr:hypothetical protein [Gemmatimonadales bacterium]